MLLYHYYLYQACIANYVLDKDKRQRYPHLYLGVGLTKYISMGQAQLKIIPIHTMYTKNCTSLQFIPVDMLKRYFSSFDAYNAVIFEFSEQSLSLSIKNNVITQKDIEGNYMVIAGVQQQGLYPTKFNVTKQISVLYSTFVSHVYIIVDVSVLSLFKFCQYDYL